jgi:glycosyltransferase involved in cell wall biosynthesis
VSSYAERITVVVPTLDDGDHLEQALRSLLRQEGGPPSIVVVDDGCEDDSVAVARATAPGARIVSSGGRATGPSRARNVGVAAVTTPLLGFLDADDAWPQERLVRDLARFDADPTLEALLGRSRYESEVPALLARHVLDADQAMRLWHLGSLTVRLETWFAVGPLDEQLARSEDIDWFQRAIDHGHAPTEHDDITLFHRKRPDSYTKGGVGSARETLGILHHLVRRRQREGLLPPPTAPPEDPISP